MRFQSVRELSFTEAAAGDEDAEAHGMLEDLALRGAEFQIYIS